MAKKPITSRRRTLAELHRLSHAQIKSELLAVGLRPLELVAYVEHFGIGPDPRPRLESHQRYDYTEHDAEWRKDDPFFTAGATRPFDLFANDRYRLHGYELDSYVESLPLTTIIKTLDTFRTDHRLSSLPQRSWGDADYRKELRYRLSHADEEAFQEAESSKSDTVEQKKRKKGEKH